MGGCESGSGSGSGSGKCAFSGRADKEVQAF